MGGPRTAELPVTEMETAADDGSAGHLPRQFYGANGTRSEHRALARLKYNLLASEATEGS